MLTTNNKFSHPAFQSPFWDLNSPDNFNAVTLTATGETLTYSSLATFSDKIASSLRPRQIFGLKCSNSLSCLGLYLGALRKGAIPLLLDGSLAEEDCKNLMNKYEIGTCFDSKRGEWSSSPQKAILPQIHENIGLLLSTSGSTGSPKLVCLSKNNLEANAKSIVEYLGLSSKEVAITTLPMHYSFGLSIINSHLGCGARIVLTDVSVTQSAFWRQFKDNGITSLSGVPTLWRLLRRIRFDRMELPSLRILTQAGGSLEKPELEEISQSAESKGWRFFVMYGQTEATARISYVPPEQLREKLGSIGIPIPGGQLAIINEQGKFLVDCDAEGELVYKGPNVMLGYAETLEDLIFPTQDEWLHTGDLGMRDADGFFWITGRLKRFIKLFGHRVNLDEIENWIRSQGSEVGVVGRDDLLMVAIVGASENTVEELRGKLIKKLHCHVTGINILNVQKLPIGANGKIQYAKLLEKFEI